MKAPLKVHADKIGHDDVGLYIGVKIATEDPLFLPFIQERFKKTLEFHLYSFDFFLAVRTVSNDLPQQRIGNQQ